MRKRASITIILFMVPLLVLGEGPPPPRVYRIIDGYCSAQGTGSDIIIPWGGSGGAYAQESATGYAGYVDSGCIGYCGNGNVPAAGLAFGWSCGTSQYGISATNAYNKCAERCLFRLHFWSAGGPNGKLAVVLQLCRGSNWVHWRTLLSKAKSPCPALTNCDKPSPKGLPSCVVAEEAAEALRSAPPWLN